MRLRIESAGATGRTARVWIDDVEVSRDVRSVSVAIGVDRVTVASVEYLVRDGLELDVIAEGTCRYCEKSAIPEV